jgi:hypothetical protein
VPVGCDRCGHRFPWSVVLRFSSIQALARPQTGQLTAGSSVCNHLVRQIKRRHRNGSHIIVPRSSASRLRNSADPGATDDPYPQRSFENKNWFDKHFPADFIVEYLVQTRGWFYTMTVLSTALFDRPPFKNCLCHGVILAEGGKKLSKSLRNFPHPEDVFQSIDSDALRWFLI